MVFGWLLSGLGVFCAVTGWNAGGLIGFGWYWFSASLLAVGVIYLKRLPQALGKRPSGGIGFVHVLLLLPYFAVVWGLWHVERALVRREAYNEVTRGLYVGRRLYGDEIPAGVTLVVDLTAEFPEPPLPEGVDYLSVPTLDGTAPDDDSINMAIEIIKAAEGKVYIHCASGTGRSATMAAAVLMRRRRIKDVAKLCDLLREKRPGIRLNAAQRSFLARWIQT